MPSHRLLERWVNIWMDEDMTARNCERYAPCSASERFASGSAYQEKDSSSDSHSSIGSDGDLFQLAVYAHNANDQQEPDRDAPMVFDITCSYLREIGRRPLLSKEEEARDAILVKEGSEEARNRMIEHNLRLVVSIAKRFSNKGVPFLDLIEEGNIGLMHALDKFEPERGFRFSTYAAWWIRSMMESAVRHQGRTIRLPEHIGQRLTGILKAKSQLERTRTGGRGASAKEIAQAMGWEREKVEETLSAAAAPLSLDEEGEGEQGAALRDILAADAGCEPEHQMEQVQLRWTVFAHVERLPPKERYVISHRFGLEDDDPKTFECIAQRMGVSAERVRQLQTKAIKALRRTLTRSGMHL